MNETEIFYQALLARDPRFDGKFFVGVKTTGIYCRPICPARPKRENIRFFKDAHEAENAGFRPCLRCRPESAPLSPAWMGRSAVVQRALRLISTQSILPGDENAFANLFGISARHLRRLFEQEIGKTPKQISIESRLNFARKLIVETDLPMTEIAYSSGFASIRRFNDAIQNRFHRSPTELRKRPLRKLQVLKTTPKKGAQESGSEESGLRLTLSFRPPLDWSGLLHFFGRHAVPGAEAVNEKEYRRIFKIGGHLGALSLQAEPTPGDREATSLRLRVVADNYEKLFEVVQRIRHIFDLDCDPLLLSNAFQGARPLDRLHEKYPGARIPRGWDPYETAVCAILGQLVSVEQARRLAAQIVNSYGTPVVNPLDGTSARLFPGPKVLAEASLSEVGTTKARKKTIRELSKLIVQNKINFLSAQDPSRFKDALLNIKGIGPWSAEYICMRALGDTDAYPGSDLILKRAGELYPKLDLEKFKPWRAYAAVLLWREFAEKLSYKKGNKR